MGISAGHGPEPQPCNVLHEPGEPRGRFCAKTKLPSAGGAAHTNKETVGHMFHGGNELTEVSFSGQKARHQTGPALQGGTARRGGGGHKVAPGSCQATGHLAPRQHHSPCTTWLRDIPGYRTTVYRQPGLGDVPRPGDCPMCRCLGLGNAPGSGYHHVLVSGGARQPWAQWLLCRCWGLGGVPESADHRLWAPGTGTCS